MTLINSDAIHFHSPALKVSNRKRRSADRKIHLGKCGVIWIGFAW